jgi:hypothetical protein
MVAKEYCCYTRPYSSIEGFQLAHTLYYSASVEEEGVVLAVRQQQGEECVTEQVICPVGDFGRLMSLMRYLCENGVGLGHWLDVLDDAGQVYWPCTAANGQQEGGKPARFVAFAGFEGANLVHNPELTQSV